MVEILYSIRPEVGRFCWDNTIYKGQDEVEIPPEITASHVEAQEEMMQKLQMSWIKCTSKKMLKVTMKMTTLS